ncbi:MAG TPA: F0F1 ATP synthase subunit B [Tetragenococcus sp.]|nr:F0F1 ATP synthase subunit B [Tetragenococcus sp.]
MLNQLVLSVAEVHNTTISSIVVVSGSFLILLALLKKYAWNAVVGMMDKREEKIASDIDTAEQSREKAQKLAEERQTQLNSSRAQATDIIRNAKSTGESSRQQLIADGQTQVSKMREKAQSDILNERENAMESVKDDVADLSLEIAKKILQEELSEQTHRALIDQYIESMGSDHETR